MLTYYEIAVRLILSTILGGIIGIEKREGDLTSYGEVSEVEIQ